MLARLSCALLIATSFLKQSISQEPKPKLKLVVVLIRHGVRSPTDIDLLKKYSPAQQWPDLEKDWHTQCCADLTPRGAELARILGTYYRSYYADKGLLPKTGCPTKEDVYIWADNEQRTFITAKALAQGLADKIPNCRIEVNSLSRTFPDCSLPKKCSRGPSDPQDLWFHPLPALWSKVTKEDQSRIQHAADDINRQYEDLRSTYLRQLNALQSVLRCCEPSLCPKGPASCKLLDLPHEAKLGQGGITALKWEGPFAVGSTAAEVFLLEYANNMECNDVGWGKVKFEIPYCPGTQYFRDMQKIHTAYFQQVQRPFIVAQIQGSNLARQILTELSNATKLPEPSRGKFVVFAGHDTNIANVAALFGLSWKLWPDLPNDDSPPAGALVFELYKRQSGYYVQAHYVYQTVEQLRRATSLSLDYPPKWVPLRIPTCHPDCTFERFSDFVGPRILERFVTPKHTLE